MIIYALVKEYWGGAAIVALIYGETLAEEIKKSFEKDGGQYRIEPHVLISPRNFISNESSDVEEIKNLLEKSLAKQLNTNREGK